MRLGFVRFVFVFVAELELDRKRSISRGTPSGIFGCGIQGLEVKGTALAREPGRGQYWKTVVDNSGTASREIGRNISFRCAFFFGIYDTASAGSFSSLEQEFVCAGIFSFFLVA